MKLGLVSLGCDKNTVDSERILAALAGYGAHQVRDLAEAEVIVVNTCGFIDAAKEESIETLLDVGRYKREGNCRAVVALGCLVEQYRDELEPSLSEIDLFIGLRDVERLIPELQDRGLLGPRLEDHPGMRQPITERRHVRYMKVSEGCDHGCAFCAIPMWRGKHRSFGADALVAEAGRLEAQGAVELNLVAQDLAFYGREFRDGTDLTSLLRRLLDETSIPWFRLLYIYSAGLREPLVELIATEDRILPYIDMPIQHASDPVLERMRRPERRDRLYARVEGLRSAIPDLTLRTTIMVGFPGETEDDFRSLVNFMEDVEFDRLGAFAFSPQEGTRAAGMEDLFVPDDVAVSRLEEVIEVQRAISADLMGREIGRTREAMVERVEDDRIIGRTRAQADDVDGITFLGPASDMRPAGTLVEVEITGAGDFDLEGSILRELRSVATADGLPLPGRVGRALPVATIGLDGSWGR
ncbi:MAG: 30S ribosomal protein S12 methylthiotransferase RimO [Gemmatimonadales bacterium]|nr:MAG: 30S ribosomal protein S12 methylthiotransferase RimO [Gemmatimonadales bacterium]